MRLVISVLSYVNCRIYLIFRIFVFTRVLNFMLEYNNFLSYVSISLYSNFCYHRVSFSSLTLAFQPVLSPLHMCACVSVLFLRPSLILPFSAYFSSPSNKQRVGMHVVLAAKLPLYGGRGGAERNRLTISRLTLGFRQ